MLKSYTCWRGAGLAGAMAGRDRGSHALPTLTAGLAPRPHTQHLNQALLQSLSDAVKQLGEGNQQQQTRVRVEEAKQDFISCCDVICFQVVRPKLKACGTRTGRTYASSL